jgi:CheY-like chemotaxis protein
MNVRKRILLVDDDEAVIEFLGVKLSEFDLVSAGTPEEALELARTRTPDLVLCDIELPGMDGGDISAALFAQPETHHIPLVFLTALVTPEELAAKGNQLAGRAAISKQSPIEEILGRLRSVLA